jgi:hypothetical protein
MQLLEAQAALSLCNKTGPGEDGIKFGLLKELPLEGKQFLLHIFNDVLAIGEVPESWH